MWHPYVAFEGPIAAGKSTLAKLFARHMQFKLLLEEFEDNEFFADFYANKSRWALPMQLDFLVSRHRQLAVESIAADRGTVADHTFAKDGIFARLLLDTS